MVKNTPKKWRRRLGKRDGKRLRKMLTVILVLECLYGLNLTGQLPVIFQRDHFWQYDWVMSGTGEKGSDIYGIWFDRKTWRLEFYHTHRSINDH